MGRMEKFSQDAKECRGTTSLGICNMENVHESSKIVEKFQNSANDQSTIF